MEILRLSSGRQLESVGGWLCAHPARTALLCAVSPVLMGGTPVFADEADPRVTRFVSAARNARSDEAIATWTVRTLGSSEAMFKRLLPLILSGEKTGTFSLGDAPPVGEYCVVTHFDGTPALIWRVVAVEIVPFDVISVAHLQVEGEVLRNVEAWRKVHLAAWAAQFKGKSRVEIGKTPVVVQRFVLIHPQAPAGVQ